MRQRTLAAQSGFERYTEKAGRAEFLEEMEQVVPWAELCALIEPVYPKAGPGRPPVGVERMLRIYFLQQWFNFSDPAVEGDQAYRGQGHVLEECSPRAQDLTCQRGTRAQLRPWMQPSPPHSKNFCSR